jgi:hypothetical protein
MTLKSGRALLTATFCFSFFHRLNFSPEYINAEPLHSVIRLICQVILPIPIASRKSSGFTVLIAAFSFIAVISAKSGFSIRNRKVSPPYLSQFAGLFTKTLSSGLRSSSQRPARLLPESILSTVITVATAKDLLP